MIETLTFLNNHMFWLISIGGFILFAIFIWKEFHQFGTRKFWVKVIVSFLAIVSLVLIALRPAISVRKGTANIALLTKGYDYHQLDSLRKVHKKLKLITYKASDPIFDNQTAIDSVFLLGYGIEPFDFWQLDERNVKYLAKREPSGITRFTYNFKNKIGQDVVFKGLYNKPEKDKKLILQGPGGLAIDSVILNAADEYKFQLQVKPNVKGKYLFSLVEKDSLGTVVSRDPVPILVENPMPLKILIVNGFPTFETKYLKNYLAEKGHQVAVKTQITKGRYKFEYFNIEKLPIRALSRKNLKPFDLVIIDATSFQNLGKKSLTAIENCVRENGLGVFIQPNGQFYISSIKITSFNFVSDKKAEVIFKEIPKSKTSKYAYVFKNEFPIQSIHNDRQNNIISAYKRVGKGRIGSTVLENTYELLLKGETTAYQQIWSDIIGKVSGREVSSIQWESNTIITYKDHPFEFNLRTSIEKPEIEANETYRVSLQQHIDVNNLWRGITYPYNFGWNTLSVRQDTTVVFNYFVTDTIHWQSLAEYKKVRENKRQFDKLYEKTRHKTYPSKPVNLTLFFITFLLCMGYLWLEPKIASN
ncbi:hypothetical protein [Aquimarina celericrescens]|uniref:hypothetical protein n=1 Tax=Aquimarina celericrescens TaxID=1964542 RepID=UPI00366CAE54